MAKLFGGAPKVQAPEAPKPVRMPVETDPSVMQAAQRTRSAALARQGRLSTIMTDMTKSTTGSSGQKLGA
jgi:hypothetical protein